MSNPIDDAVAAIIARLNEEHPKNLDAFFRDIPRWINTMPLSNAQRHEVVDRLAKKIEADIAASKVPATIAPHPPNVDPALKIDLSDGHFARAETPQDASRVRSIIEKNRIADVEAKIHAILAPLPRDDQIAIVKDTLRKGERGRWVIDPSTGQFTIPEDDPRLGIGLDAVSPYLRALLAANWSDVTEQHAALVRVVARIREAAIESAASKNGEAFMQYPEEFPAALAGHLDRGFRGNARPDRQARFDEALAKAVEIEKLTEQRDAEQDEITRHYAKEREIISLQADVDRMRMTHDAVSIITDMMACMAGPLPPDERAGTPEKLTEVTGGKLLRPAERLRRAAARGKALLAQHGKPTAKRAPYAALVAQSLRDAKHEGVFSTLKASLIALTADRAHLLALWARDGYNVFELTHDLAAGLSLTDAPDDGLESRLPYPALAIRVPPGIVPFFDASEEQRWVDTIWVCEYEEEALDGEGRMAGVAVPLREVLAVHQGLAVAHVDFALRAEDVATLDAARRVVGNFLLWLEATGGHRKHPQDKIPPKLAAKREANGETWPKEWIFGKEVKLAPELKRAAAEAAIGDRGRQGIAGWKLRARFVVRGHWRNQAVGPGRKDHRRKWIQAFWKGPKGEEAWSHLYVAKNAEEKT